MNVQLGLFGGLADFERQTALIRAAAPEDDIYDVMEAAGLTIDDLIYTRNRALKWSGHRPPSLADFKPLADKTPIVSFFTGCGGMDLGFEAVGLAHKAAFEFNEIFCRTLRANRPS